MSENKTLPTDASVMDFINALDNPVKREQSIDILKMMTEITGEKPVMWGSSIIGFGQCHYKYDSGREGDMPIIGYSPRKRNFSLYVGASSRRLKPLLDKLGKHSTGKTCLYINNLKDVDTDVLREIINQSYVYYKAKYK